MHISVPGGLDEDVEIEAGLSEDEKPLAVRAPKKSKGSDEEGIVNIGDVLENSS
jgi:hypothetical protein